MKLDFEIVAEVGQGQFPDLIHFPNTQAQTFYIQNGSMEGTPTNKIDNGEWGETTFQDSLDVSPDTNISHFQVDILQGFGTIGNYKSGDIHKMIIYEFAFEMDRYLNSGNIKHSIDTPISTFTLSLENPDTENPEHPGNVAINEENSLLSPGAKVKFEFSMGDSEPYDLGTFYVDRSNFVLLSETANVDGRNLIGKALKEQTLNEENEITLDYVHLIIENLLQYANLDSNQYLVEATSKKNSFKFDPKLNVLQALEEIFKAMINWQIVEEYDGTVVIGNPDYAGFSSKGTYTFYRDKDIFSRNIIRDDLESYRKVCVHTPDFERKVYKDVIAYQGWNLLENKTLFVEVPEGTKLIEITEYAYNLSMKLAIVGKVESFTGPFRPHILCGDEAVIIDSKGNQSLGLITEVEHIFGKNGFSTIFTVDSGGRLGKGRVADYINKIARGKGSSSIGYEELID